MNALQSDVIVCIQYCLISVICTFSLIYFIFVTDRSAEHSSELLFYKFSMGFAALCAVTDIVFALRQFCMIPFSGAVNYLSEILYSLGSICGAFCWYIYSEKKQRSGAVLSAKSIKLLAVPFALMCLFTLTTPIHKLCFSFDGQEYIRGVLNVPFTCICSVFIIFSGIFACIKSFRKEHHSRTVLLRMLFLYSMVLTLAQVVHVSVGPILPFRTLFATLIFMFVTLRGMTETVSIDALSHINNRFSLDRVLESKILNGDKFWLMMLDIDDFKHINDTYGHISGDEAIYCTAQAIVHSVPRSYFVARFGGDEFAVVAPYDDESLIEPLEEMIRTELKNILTENNSPFTVDITAGYAARNDNIRNIPDMIEAADRILYEKKRAKKLQTGK